jgi:predicted  nucleic acid-binding Zn-ribbon protein
MLKMPRIITNILFGIGVTIYILTLLNFPVHSNTVLQLEDEISQKEQQIAEKESVLETVERRIREISSSNYSLTQRIALLNKEITTLEQNIEKTEQEIEGKVLAINEKQEQLEKTKGLMDEISGDLYIQSRYKLANFFLDTNNWFTLVESIYLRRNTITVLRGEIEKMGIEFSSLAESKAELDKQMDDLDKQREGLDEAYKLLADERARVQAELSKEVANRSGLSAEITDLTQKVSQLQAALIAARSAGFVSTGGHTGTDNGTAISQAPAGHFGVFSIGAYTHRNGMSQWGARARADAGQNVNDILGFYYPGTILRTGTVVINGIEENIMDSIPVDGHGTVNFEDYYLLGIKEMPESWPMEVLKAQAIAARTYAVRRTDNGRSSICTTQSCQVFNLPLKTGRWVEAVNATRGIVLTNGDGTPALTQYAAVHGGWVSGVGWDTQSGTGNNWFSDAWDRASQVTWFYNSWYREGYDYRNPPTSGGESCGRSPWLSHQEMVDLINAHMIKNDMGLKATPDKSRLVPSDYGKCPSYLKPSSRPDYGRTDKTPYSSQELKNLLTNPVNSIDTVAVSFSNDGLTNTVSFSTDRGVVNMSGMEFKSIYNQMAPGHMRIQQQAHYAFFNIEKS